MVVGAGVVEGPAAVVEVHRHRQLALRAWPVPAQRDAGQLPGDKIVFDLHHLDARRAGHELAAPCSPGIGYRQGEQRGQAGGLHRLQRRSGLRIEVCHLAPAFAGPAAGASAAASRGTGASPPAQ